MWLGARHHATNYGVFKFAPGKQVQAHAFAWRSAVCGPLPDGPIVFMHSCDVNYPAGSLLYRPCCEPSHLYPGSPRANIQDAAKKDRMAYGDAHPNIGLPSDMIPIAQARLLAGHRQVDIARDLGVSQACISRLKRGERKHVPPLRATLFDQALTP